MDFLSRNQCARGRSSYQHFITEFLRKQPGQKKIVIPVHV